MEAESGFGRFLYDTGHTGTSVPLYWIRPSHILTSLLTAIIAVTNVVAVPVTDSAYGNIATNNIPETEEQVVDATSVEGIVRTYFSDIPVMIEVARCESTFRHTLPDGSILRGRVDSADTGVMQINMRYHGDHATRLGLDLTDLYDNMAYARDLYARHGTRPWSASAPCWEHTIAMR